jgi:hypothetical protein
MKKIALAMVASLAMASLAFATDEAKPTTTEGQPTDTTMEKKAETKTEMKKGKKKKTTKTEKTEKKGEHGSHDAGHTDTPPASH